MSSLPPDTPEQALITQYKGSKLVVVAYAGTGKTTTLIKYARANPTKRMLYLAYNRAIRDEAAEKFPANVECKTSHQLAYASIGKRYAHKLVPGLSLPTIKAAISCSMKLAREISDTLNAFTADAIDRFMPHHVNGFGTKAELTPEWREFAGEVMYSAQLLWEKMSSVDDPFPITHDAYLKLFQLSQPNLSRRYSDILFDEAQDATPVTSAIVLSQTARVIFVGDPHQQIYRWRGADNALNVQAMADADRLFLTHSFRFGPQVAMVANALLEFKGETRPVIGRGGDDDILQALPDDLPHQAVLHRTVMGVITTALQASEQGQKIYWVGGIEAYNLRHLGHVFWLSKNRKEHIQDEAFTRQYEHFADYVEQAKATGDAEMRRSLMLLKVYNDIPQRLAALEQQTVKEEAEASITVTTVHRAKGLEWDNVALFYDFPDIFELEETPDQQDDELNLLYVGVTRAIKRLALNASVESILRHIIDRRRQKNDQSDSPVFSN